MATLKGRPAEIQKSTYYSILNGKLIDFTDFLQPCTVKKS